MKLLLSYVLIAFLPLMCSKSASENYKSEAYLENEVINIAEEASEVSVAKPSEAKNSSPKIIKEGFLRFETQDLDKTFSQISNSLTAYKGYIQNDYTNKSYNRISRHLIVRIPTEQFQNTVDAISKDVTYFDSKRISTKDVTEEFIDLEARLKTKKTLEKRYLELLDKAKTVEDVLNIERELSKIREEIEAKEGRIKYLQNKVSFSTLDIEFYKYTDEAPVTLSYGSKMWNALKSGFNGISLFFLGLLHIWPFILILAFSIFFFRKWLKKRKK
ncbi:DUF4349 domain-containing protein [Tamlana fucoidanivorans]|uniref:DUF4349 domain-containing protein n=1 Tax=Allotamlana fucoidanivorans TaxID=2583814 RepID=A0A5C4SSI4_9FLAO|nr:DUF4349 domain-containing protein [Tamlana fucoidanivorans]TNJ47088.1 DUF4349 domain-containing protein [Tamlana fucoidanivorans]